MPMPVSWGQGADGVAPVIDRHDVVLGPGRFGFEALEREPRLGAGRRPAWSGAPTSAAAVTRASTRSRSGRRAKSRSWVDPVRRPAGMLGAYQTTPASPGTGIGTEDYFVARLSADGSTLLWCTYVGGDATDWADGLQVDSGGVCTLTGCTSSTNYPTTAGVHQPDPRGEGDAFVTRLAADGQSLIWSTRLDGSGGDAAFAVAVDAQGVATVAGKSKSTDFPATRGSVAARAETRSSASSTPMVGASFVDGDRRLEVRIGCGTRRRSAGRRASAIAGVTWSERLSDHAERVPAQRRRRRIGPLRRAARHGDRTDPPRDAARWQRPRRSDRRPGRVRRRRATSPSPATPTRPTSRPRPAPSTRLRTAAPTPSWRGSTRRCRRWSGSTYLGGRGTDRVRALHGDALGIVTVGGNAVDCGRLSGDGGRVPHAGGQRRTLAPVRRRCRGFDLPTTPGAFQAARARATRTT